MPDYVIGDVQGCFDSLLALLEKVNFDPQKDRLGFVGDLVNRGPKSLETLRFIRQLQNPMVVLGNHDLHLLALYFLKDHAPLRFKHIKHTLHAVLTDGDCDTLIHWLLQQPLIYHDSEKNFVMTHAGIPPQWSIEEAIHHADETQKIMQHDPVSFFKNIYGNAPEIWHPHLAGWDRARYIINAFTRMRYCTRKGTLDLKNKTDQTHHIDFQPWFSWIKPSQDILFGHWASLQGHCDNPRVFALDTGCAWGNSLTALCLDDKRLFQVPACEKR